jgi:hypothetical protein
VSAARSTPRARIETPTAHGANLEALVHCVRCGHLLGGLELEIASGADNAARLHYRRTVFTEELVPRGARNAATGLPAFGPRDRVRSGRSRLNRRREPGHRGDSFWASLTGPAFVYCPERSCIGQVVDPADLALGGQGAITLDC